MNDSLDLRNRILKMRENSLSLKEVKPEALKEDAKNRQNLHTTTIIKDSKPESSKKKIVQQNKNEDIQNILVQNNEAQFRILANKFNEAVEVILELSEQVKKLEKSVYKEKKKSKKQSFFSVFFNLKTFVLLFLISLFVFGTFTLPFDTSKIKLMLVDVLSSI